MQEPFCSVPLIWIIQEDILASRLPAYKELGWKNLLSSWKNALSRADVVVFPDFSLPVILLYHYLYAFTSLPCITYYSVVPHLLFLLYQILYSVLDTGNFFVIPGSPVDVWAAESYRKTHSKIQSRKDNGFNNDDMLVLILGSSFFYNELSWDYAVAMHAISPLLIKYARRKDVRGSYKFLFLCGNSTDGYDDALQVSKH